MSSYCAVFSLDLPQSEPSTHLPNEAVPAPPAVMPHQLNVLGVLRYPMGPIGPRAPSVSLQPAPFAIPPQIPVHLHPPGLPLTIPPMAVQSLPPPPPPPPPVQQGSLTVLPTDSLPQVCCPNHYSLLFTVLYFEMFLFGCNFCYGGKGVVYHSVVLLD